MESELDPFNEGLENKGKYYPMVVLSNKKVLLDATYSDLVLKIGSESIQSHAAVVASRCIDIIGVDQLKKPPNSKKKLEVKIKDGVASVTIMNKVLEFLFTGMVDFPKTPDKEILHLTVAARYFKLGRLCYLCERWLREHLTIESVFHLLKAANEINEARIKGFCIQFALQNYNAFISNKDGIYILGIELFQEVVAAFQTNPAPPEELRLSDNPDTLIHDFKNLFDNMYFAVDSIVLGGETIKFHKSILAAHSDSLVTALMKDESAIRISPQAFKSMLRFSYYGEDDIEPLPACELVDFCRRYKLSSLLRICEDKIRTSIAVNTVLPILSVAYLPSEGKQDLVEELKNKSIPFILQNLPKIDLSLIKTFNPLMTIDLLLELQGAWKRGDYGLGKLNLGGGGAPVHQNLQQPPVVQQQQVRAPPPQGMAPAPPARKDPPATGTGLLGAQRNNSNRPPPPPRNDRGGTPAPPPRNPPPPVGGAPPPALSIPAKNESESSEDTATTPGTKKDKKEEEKRKKDELKRIQKEKKERAKMEKKFKPGGGKNSKEIF